MKYDISVSEHLDRLDSYFPNIEILDNYLLVGLMFLIVCVCLWRITHEKDDCCGKEGKGHNHDTRQVREVIEDDKSGAEGDGDKGE